MSIVMDLVVNPILSLARDQVIERIKCVLRLQENVSDLEKAKEELELAMKEVEEKIQRATEASEEEVPTERVERWRREVHEWEAKMANIFKENEKLKDMCCVGCPLNCWSGYKISKEAAEMANIKEFLDEGQKLDPVTKRIAPPVQLLNDKSLHLTTTEGYLETAVRYLEDETMVMVGMWGMGGVGKTTLLKRINNHPYVQTAGFDFVIWVVVSQELNLDKLQQDIAERLNLKLDAHAKTTESRAKSIRHFLKSKSFLLLLDDMWEAFDLDLLGIPICATTDTDNAPRCNKVVFTTRFEQACDQMSAFQSQMAYKKIKLECLKPDEAWQLFLTNVGSTVQASIKSDQRVHGYAQRVASKCAGLPLALVVIARAMSRNKTWHEWKDAATSMDELRIQEILGDKSELLFPILKVSYDRLPNDQMRQCFLCCAMWPEDDNIREDDLIWCWLGLGHLGGSRDITAAFNKAHSIIEGLKRTGMVEETILEYGICVKLHDVIRGMALWIASDQQEARNNRWVAQSRKKKIDVDKWIEAERVYESFFSMVGPTRFELPYCPNLTYLMMKATCFPMPFKKRLSFDGLAQCLPALTYLHIEVASMQVEPPTILPSGLQYLHLNIKNRLYCDGISIPQEWVNLKELRYMIIWYGEIEHIPKGLISGMQKLELLDLSHSKYKKWGMPDEAGIEEIGRIRGLKGLGIRLQVSQLDCLHRIPHVPLWQLWVDGEGAKGTLELPQNLFSSGIFPRSLHSLEFIDALDAEEMVVAGEGKDQFNNLEVLKFFNLGIMKKMVWKGVSPRVLFQNVSEVEFHSCSRLKDITWIAQLPYLEILRIILCERLVEVIAEAKEGEEEGDGGEVREQVAEATSIMFLDKLKMLQLSQLPELRSICRISPTLTLPSLQRVAIFKCPRLSEATRSFLRKETEGEFKLE